MELGNSDVGDEDLNDLATSLHTMLAVGDDAPYPDLPDSAIKAEFYQQESRRRRSGRPIVKITIQVDAGSIDVEDVANAVVTSFSDGSLHAAMPNFPAVLFV